ncbi:MAG: preprotein translocase subunit SecE [Clostridia bacterium]|nr:preprotein translocase subunit SecE [Clostridia bacterium]
MAEEKTTVVKTKKEKPQKPKKEKQSGKVKKFFTDLKSEMNKITWYSKKDTAKSSGLVIAVIVVFAVIIGLIDLGFAELIALLGRIY